jgi:hypothetical protein
MGERGPYSRLCCCEWKILMSNYVIKCFCVHCEKLMHEHGKLSCEWGLT